MGPPTVLPPKVEDAVKILGPKYRDLLVRAVAVLTRDERVRAMWLSGSLARGLADKASDLDLVVAVADDALKDFCGSWRTWLEEITPTVLARPLGSTGSFFAVIGSWERCDVVVEGVGSVATSQVRDRIPVFDKGDLSSLIPIADPVPGPSSGQIEFLITEAFRIYGQLAVVVDREDWLLGLEGIYNLRILLYQLFVESNAPAQRYGLKRWSAKLTKGQRTVLESMPTGKPNKDAVIEGHVQLIGTFTAHARDIAAALGVEWPDRLESATYKYLHDRLGI